MDQDEFANLRAELLADSFLKDVLPSWLRSHRDLEHVRALSQTKGGYRERREFVRESLQPAFDLAESIAPGTATTEVALRSLSSDEVERVWRNAVERKEGDPEGALTLARTLLEMVMKHIAR